MKRKRPPTQPLTFDEQGVVRFQENAIVNYLYDFCRDHGFGMNEIAGLPFKTSDRRQFAQLIGYSVDGYCDLSYVDEEEQDRTQAKREAYLNKVNSVAPKPKTE